MKDKSVKDVLKRVNDELNRNNIVFATGGSSLLSNYNLLKEPKDIDIVISGSEVKKVKEVISKFGIKEEVEWKSKFKTTDFFAYNIDGITVEFMADFGVELSNKFIYRLNLINENIKRCYLEGTYINYCLLEDWYVAYLAIGDPKNRSKIIEEYFEKYGIERKDILERYLNQNLTSDIKEKIKFVLSF